MLNQTFRNIKVSLALSGEHSWAQTHPNTSLNSQMDCERDLRQMIWLIVFPKFNMFC